MTSPEEDDEKIINWKEEATAIINDVKAHVAQIEISNKLHSTDSNIYLNIKTIEGNDYCVSVSGMGFRIVGNAFDTDDAVQPELEHREDYYETPYALLDVISPRYIESFGSKLYQQLLKLQQNNFDEEEEDNIDETEES